MTSHREKDLLLEQALENRIELDALDEELAELVAVASQVHAFLEETPPPPHGLRPGRSAFLTAAAQQSERRSRRVLPFLPLPRRFFRTLGWGVPLATVVVLVIYMGAMMLAPTHTGSPILPGENHPQTMQAPTLTTEQATDPVLSPSPLATPPASTAPKTKEAIKGGEEENNSVVNEPKTEEEKKVEATKPEPEKNPTVVVSTPRKDKKDRAKIRATRDARKKKATKVKTITPKPTVTKLPTPTPAGSDDDPFADPWPTITPPELTPIPPPPDIIIPTIEPDPMISGTMPISPSIPITAYLPFTSCVPITMPIAPEDFFSDDIYIPDIPSDDFFNDDIYIPEPSQ